MNKKLSWDATCSCEREALLVRKQHLLTSLRSTLDVIAERRYTGCLSKIVSEQSKYIYGSRFELLEIKLIDSALARLEKWAPESNSDL